MCHIYTDNICATTVYVRGLEMVQRRRRRIEREAWGKGSSSDFVVLGGALVLDCVRDFSAGFGRCFVFWKG